MGLNRWLQTHPRTLAVAFSLLTLFGLTILIPAIVGACLQPIFANQPSCFKQSPAWSWLGTIISLLLAGAWLYVAWLGIQVLTHKVMVSKSLTVDEGALDHRYLFTPVSTFGIAYNFQEKLRQDGLPIPKTLDQLLELQDDQKFDKVLNCTNLGPTLGLVGKKPIKDWYGIWLICTDEAHNEGKFLADYLIQQGFKGTIDILKVGPGLSKEIVETVQAEIEKTVDTIPKANHPRIAITVTSGTVPISMGSIAAAINLNLDMLYYTPSGEVQLYQVNAHELELPQQF